MSLPIYQRVAVTDAGDVIPGAEYTVINENTGVAAPIYSDRTGATLLSAPYFADSAGTIQFFIAQGTTFRVAASGGVGTYTDRYVYGVAEAVLVQADGNVGIGTSSPNDKINIVGGGASIEGSASGFTGGEVRLGTSTADTQSAISTMATGTPQMYFDHRGTTSGQWIWRSSSAERMRIDSAGNLLVATTTTNSDVAGHVMYGGALAGVSTQSAATRPLYINRLSSDGDIIELSKDGTTVGSISCGNSGTYLYIGASASVTGLGFGGTYVFPTNGGSAGSNNTNKLGSPSFRWNEIFCTNGTINTSDRTQKQDILEITTAEYNVAKACKGLLRSFRWIDAVEEKGNDARIHFGIIAQDLQDAFTAEGLDAGRYAMFTSDTWWETQTEVAAIEAADEVTDEDGNVTTEAVEAKDAYTRTDTFQTLLEAPAGATERTRLGVRYSELLAFIIAAI